QQQAGTADPVGQSGCRYFNAFALEALYLTVYRKMIGILVDNDLGQQSRTRDTFIDRALRKFPDTNTVSTRSCICGTTVPANEQLAWDAFEFSADLLSAPRPAANIFLWFDDHLFARKISR